MTGDLTKQCLPRPQAAVWRSYLDEWDRALRAGNYPESTRYNYELAVTQLAEFQPTRSPAGDLFGEVLR
ncbi:hypothetical protein [Sciscionella marina]|uniref:hypothetical protein n=1 Tax=Sciscionella marina TaxID=508770 RepID=UPI0003751209|nr:hypothetical protein [Sciscionella marina]